MDLPHSRRLQRKGTAMSSGFCFQPALTRTHVPRMVGRLYSSRACITTKTWFASFRGTTTVSAKTLTVVQEILELQRSFHLGLAQQGHRLLQIITLLAGHAQLIALNLRLHLELRILE